jgi:hypothetical protein
MAVIKNENLLAALIAETRQLDQALKAFVETKNAAILLQRPQSNKWSFLDCIVHLNQTYDVYLPRIEAAIEQNATRTGTAYRPGLFGNMMTNSMTPKEGLIKMKTKTLKPFVPQTEGKSQTEIISTFFANQERFIQQMEKAKTLDLGRIKLNSAIGPVLRFKLGDCFRFIAGHNQRHWLQAQRTYAAISSQDNYLSVQPSS